MGQDRGEIACVSNPTSLPSNLIIRDTTWNQGRDNSKSRTYVKSSHCNSRYYSIFFHDVQQNKDPRTDRQDKVLTEGQAERDLEQTNSRLAKDAGVRPGLLYIRNLVLHLTAPIDEGRRPEVSA